MVAFWGRRVGVALSCLMSYSRVSDKVDVVDRFSLTFLRAL